MWRKFKWKSGSNGEITFVDWVEALEWLTKGWSSKLVAVGRSAGFLRKQHCKKSLPSADIVCGNGGVSLRTLNKAAACAGIQLIKSYSQI